MRILVVTKDLASQKLAASVVGKLKTESSDLQLTIVSEGKSTGAWRKFGLEPDYVFSEIIFEALEQCDTSLILDEVSPEVVMIGIGSPINLERDFLAEASKRQCLTVALEDYPGTCKRLLPSSPDLLIVPDQQAAEEADRYLNTNSGLTVVVSGHSGLSVTDPSPVVEEFLEDIRFKYGYDFLATYVSGGTFSDLDLALACMEKTGGCLLPRFHPKFADRLHSYRHGTYRQLWMNQFRSRAVSYMHVDLDIPNLTEELVKLTDVTMGGFSNVLNTAAWHEKVVVCLDTDETFGSLYRQTGLEYPPMYESGRAHYINQPVDLRTLAPVRRGDLKPFDVELVVSSILNAVR